jgi:uncharacterized protein (PEP-CTERM system associated)
MTGADSGEACCPALLCRTRRLAATGGIALALFAGPLFGQAPVRLVPSIAGQITFTDNVELQSDSERQSDVIFELRPALGIEYNAPRLKLNGTLAASIFLYAETGERNNQAVPEVDLQGEAEVVKDFFFIEATANVRQTFINPFGAQPISPANVTDNQTTAQTYRVSPYIQGEIGSNVRYLVRDDNIWTTLSETQEAQAGDAYSNLFRATIDRVPTPLGWGFDVERNDYQFEDRSRTQRRELARARGSYSPGPQLFLFMSAGYEKSRLPLADTEDSIYGVGFRWLPNERTELAAQWEHRFFGDSYLVDFNYRGPLSVWSVHASRNITTYPEQVAFLIPGISVFALLNAQLTNRIADPLARARFVQEFMQNRGLPAVVADPLSLFVQTTYIQEDARVSYGIIGVRNSIVFNIYRTKAEPVGGEAAAIPPVLGGFNNNTQVGGGIAWSNSLTPATNLLVTADTNRTEANPPFSGRTDQWSVRAQLTRPISPRTTGFVGLRYQDFTSDFQNDYREFAAFVGASYTFR